MEEIIQTQGGNPHIESTSLKAGKHMFEYRSQKRGRVGKIQNQQITIICRILGCPTDKLAGIFIHKRLEEEVSRHDILCTLYSSDTWRLKEAEESIKHIPIFTIE